MQITCDTRKSCKTENVLWSALLLEQKLMGRQKKKKAKCYFNTLLHNIKLFHLVQLSI